MTTPAAAPPARKALTGFVLMTALAAAVAFALAAVAANVFADPRVAQGLLAGAWATFALGRFARHADVPKGYGGAVAEVALGVALGLAAMAFLREVFAGALPVWALLAGAGFGVARAHKPLMLRVRGQGAPARLLGGVLDPREIVALATLLAGYALLGVALYNMVAAFGASFGQGGKMLALAATVYALYGARLLLAFASHDTAGHEPGFVGWFRANLLRNAIVVALLVGYAAFRDDLAGVVPFFPLVEFGLGMAVLGFLFARLRALLQRERTEHATASTATPHEPRVGLVTEGEYEGVARPVARFLETGRGHADYVATLRASSMVDAGVADVVLEPAATHREPPETPPLPLAWGVAASLVAGSTLALGVGILLARFGAPLAVAIPCALLVAGLALYRTQDQARAHLQPWPALALALGGALLVAAGLWLLAGHAGVPYADALVLAAALALAGVPAYLSWRLDRRLRAGEGVPLPAELPSAMLAAEQRKMRRRAGAAALGGVAILLVVPFVLRWLATRGWAPQGFQETYADVAAGAVWILLAAGASAVIRFTSLSRSRPQVLLLERRRRDARLRLHAEIMRRLERV